MPGCFADPTASVLSAVAHHKASEKVIKAGLLTLVQVDVITCVNALSAPDCLTLPLLLADENT